MVLQVEQVFMQVSHEEYKRSLLGVYSFTGGDTVSAFAGNDKLKPLQLLQEEKEFVNAFSRLGSSSDVVNALKHHILRCENQTKIWRAYL